MAKRTPIILTNTDHFFYFSSANQVIPSVAWTKKTFNTAGAVQGLVFNTATSVFTCIESGLYLVSTNIKWSNVVGMRGLGFNVNGVRVVLDTRENGVILAALGMEHTVSYPFFFDVGDTLQIDVYHNSGAGINALAGSEIAVMLLPNE